MARPPTRPVNACLLALWKGLDSRRVWDAGARLVETCFSSSSGSLLSTLA